MSFALTLIYSIYIVLLSLRGLLQLLLLLQLLRYPFTQRVLSFCIISSIIFLLFLSIYLAILFISDNYYLSFVAFTIAPYSVG